MNTEVREMEESIFTKFCLVAWKMYTSIYLSLFECFVDARSLNYKTVHFNNILNQLNSFLLEQRKDTKTNDFQEIIEDSESQIRLHFNGKYYKKKLNM